jgi:hypothetical protein
MYFYSSMKLVYRLLFICPKKNSIKIKIFERGYPLISEGKSPLALFSTPKKRVFPDIES